MKIAIPKFSKYIGSQRIPFEVYKELLEKNFEIKFISYEYIKEADIVFVHSDLNKISDLRRINPKAKFILFKPHCEIALTCSGENLFKRIISYFFKMKKNILYNTQNIYRNNIDDADLLVCDTPRISRFFNSKGYKTVYCSLIELFNKKINKQIKSNQKNQKNQNYTKILYSGNLSHFNSNISQFLKALSKSNLMLQKEVIIYCLSSYKKKKIEFRLNKKVIIHFVNFSEENLNNLLIDCDFGWVPNKYKISSFLESHLFRVLFTSSTQIFDIVQVEKFSANAGRCLLFARYGIPFITNPNEETSMIFGNLSTKIIYENFDELVDILNKFSNKKTLVEVSSILRREFKYLDFSNLEVAKLYNAIIFN